MKSKIADESGIGKCKLTPVVPVSPIKNVNAVLL